MVNKSSGRYGMRMVLLLMTVFAGCLLLSSVFIIKEGLLFTGGIEMGWKIVADGTSGCVKEREKTELPFSAGPNY